MGHDIQQGAAGVQNIMKNRRKVQETKGAYQELGRTIGALVDEKNQSYGNSFNLSSKVLGILYPNGVKPDQYKDMLAVVRIIDKLFRVVTDRDAFGESPWQDIAGYGLLGAMNEAEL